MYTKRVPYKDFRGNPRTEEVNFNLTIPDMMRLLEEFQVIFKFQKGAKEPERTMETEEVMEYYNAFEEILLDSWGEPSEDGKYFSKDNKYKFKDSALFPATMMMFVNDTTELGKFLDNVIPSADLRDLVANTEEKLKNIQVSDDSSDALKAQVAELQAQLAAAKASGDAPAVS